MTDGTSPILDGVRERFDASTDFTVGLEEEYQLIDPGSLALTNRFEEVVEAAPPELRERLAGELIASELEFKTRAHTSFTDAARELAQGRIACSELLQSRGMALGIAGTHAFSAWQDQRIIDTPHYRLVEGELGYIAWINNTWAIHLHCGVRGADRAVAVSTAMRSVLPELLALSANSAVFLGRETRLHSTRTQTFVKSFPRCGIPDAYADWDEYARHVRLLETTGSIMESTQIWWSVRPHHSFGTIEVRICDGQTEMADALAVAGLALALIARFCADHDAGIPLPAHARGLIEENLWRAQRHGLDGCLIDLDAGIVRDTREVIARLVERTAEQQAALGLTPFTAHVRQMLEQGNGAERQLAHFRGSGGDAVALQADIVHRSVASAREVLESLTT